MRIWYCVRLSTVLRRTNMSKNLHFSFHLAFRFLFQLVFIQWTPKTCEFASYNVSILRNQFLCRDCNVSYNLWSINNKERKCGKMVKIALGIKVPEMKTCKKIESLVRDEFCFWHAANSSLANMIWNLIWSEEP